MVGAAALGLALCMAHAGAQQTPGQTPAQTPAQGDNPFPGEDTQKPAQQTQPAPGQKPGQAPAQGDNPFPGEDTNAPILPTDNSAPPPTPRESDASSVPAKRGADPDGDPVRSPDPPGLQQNDGFSSSRSGGPDLSGLENETDAKPGKSVKTKTREQLAAEDINVGGFYSEKKNWKAAQARFASAFQLDKENPDAVWGLAESERHLAMYKEAAEHYQLFLSYDPDGPHAKGARKGLEEVQSQLAGKK